MAPTPEATPSAWTFADESPAVPASSLTLIEGTSFVICDGAGDVGYGSVDGVFVGDTRICDRLVLRVDGERVQPLASSKPTPFRAIMVGRTQWPGLVVFREHWVGAGLRADVRVRNFSLEARHLLVTYDVGADLAGLFDVKDGRATGKRVTMTSDDDGLRLGTRRMRRSAMIRPSPPAEIDPQGFIRWIVDIPARGEWKCRLEVTAVRGGKEVPASHSNDDDPEGSGPLARQEAWQSRLPKLTSDVPGLDVAVERAGYDLGALRIFDPAYPDEPVVAAGAPWFMTLFGRDSILTSWMSLVLDPRLGLATLHTLARLQGTKVDPSRDEQPGRILHEIRVGDSTSLSLSKGDVYYGTADATPLFVMLVGELLRWGVTVDELRSLQPAVDAALAWIRESGDPDDDGYVECQTATDRGLVNQGWKDSWDGVSFADGRLAEGPLALVEVQAYAYAAWLAGAELAQAFGDAAAAAERRQHASDLRVRFNRDFWMPEQRAFAVALDGTKQRVDSIASNMGHCLWAGIVDDEHVDDVAERLMSPESFSGWGVRTLTTSMARYDPLSYHNGSVWPHDTAICVAGLRRVGHVEDAIRLASALLDAATVSGGELPELFSGISREEAPVPVGYPGSCRPQAWASASPLLLLRSFLGLEPNVPEGRINLDPVFPSPATSLRFDTMPLADGVFSVEVTGDAIAVRGLDPDLSVVKPLARRPPSGSGSG